MGLKKKKNIIILTLCMAVSFILYQLYFFLTITSESNSWNIIPILKNDDIKEIVHSRSEADVHINFHGIVRGVYYSEMPKYRPDSNNEFKCLKSEQKIPFENVNDDYCDCKDSTDEPSTSACANGTFYCDSQFHKKSVTMVGVPSSKVNDGICDCCDGSDEWLKKHKTLLSQSNEKHYRYYVPNCPNVCFDIVINQ